MRFARPHRKGFTLVEILTVVSIFAVTSLIATNIFVITSRFQRKAATSQKLQGDIRFAVEAIAREVRFGTIDYGCYAPSPINCDPWLSSNDL
ncbi:MAG: type II secretion system protein, partial [Candidatus Kerfeldbacteria bacterium]|nr:type II secretion system protein [Candidatus Kerfeldbacteria bacterium]